jgi:hypothetical protein
MEPGKTFKPFLPTILVAIVVVVIACVWQFIGNLPMLQ